VSRAARGRRAWRFGAAALAGGLVIGVFGVSDPASAFDRAAQPVRPIEAPFAGVNLSRYPLQSGARRLAVVMLDFHDHRDDLRRDTISGLVNANARSVRNFYLQMSNNALRFTGKTSGYPDVLGPFVSNIASTSSTRCDDTKWISEAQRLAPTAGFVEADYDNVLVVTPPKNGCTWLGLTNLDQRWAVAEVPSAAAPPVTDPYVFIHELGHALGLPHGTAARCTDNAGHFVQISNNCATGYRDPFDPMSGGYLDGLSAFHRFALGFVPTSNVGLVNSTGDYSVDAVGPNTPGQTNLVMIPVTTAPDNSAFYELELRRPWGVFDRFGPTDPAVTGVTIHEVDQSGLLFDEKLLDTTPFSAHSNADFLDAPLQPGRAFTDSAHGIRVTTLWVRDGKARVHVDITNRAGAYASAANNGIDVTEVPGTRNHMTVAEVSNGVYDITDAQPIVGTDGCVSMSSTQVRCTPAHDIVRVQLGFNNDWFRATTTAQTTVSVHGGPGNDNLSSGAGNDWLYGDEGNDVLEAASVAPNGADHIAGGAGDDTVDYSHRTGTVAVTLDGVANDGAPGEQDNVLADVEHVLLPPG
jgi:M6 family metalloprotease-like protein